jgi:beta-aspartyl-peptidase (threonine type)
MKDGFLYAFLAGLLVLVTPLEGATQEEPLWALVIHGGAGTIRRVDFTAELEGEYREKLQEALATGSAILSQGGSSLDAVEATVHVLEDSDLFNAGKGAVFTAEGRNELDAAIMDGASLQAGAVAGVTTVKNPISAARAVMEQTDHVMLSGAGADSFAREAGLEIVDPKYFFTQRRWDALQKARERERKTANLPSGPDTVDPYTRARGTVGVLALDRQGHLAAGTSTGGMTNKRWGRIGDSPIIGAGTYANAECAVSATGTGEYFIRHTVARDICARAEYLDQSVADAAKTIIFEVLEPDIGGVITLDRQGNPSMPFNTEGMYRGYILSNGKSVVEIYKD